MPYTLHTFGSNGESQLGTPAAEIVNTPSAALSLSDPLLAIRGGDNHTLLLTTSGTLFAAGDNQKGQLGLPPATVSNISSFRQLYTGISFCAATCTTSAYIINPGTPLNATASPLILTEGTSHWGELGRDGLTSTTQLRHNDHNLPVPHRPPGFPHLPALSIILPAPVIDFAAGAWHYVAVLANGEVWGWGKARNAQLGAQLTGSGKISVPMRIEGLGFTPVRVVCGKEFTYLVSAPGEGKHALLGMDRFGLQSRMPQHVRGWKDMGATWNAVFVLLDEGVLAAWGKSNLWVLVPEGLPVVGGIAVGSEHVLAVTKGGEDGKKRIISWGWGKHGNCGYIGELGCKNDMVSGMWNEICVGEEGDVVESIGAGFCTSFALMKGDT